jgi:hypothetical protein
MGMWPNEPGHTFIRGLWCVSEQVVNGLRIESYDLVSENPDELATLRAQLAEARAANARLEAERDGLRDKLTETRLFKVVEFVWLTTKQPQIERYLMEWFPEIIINIEDRKERAADAGSEGG